VLGERQALQAAMLDQRRFGVVFESHLSFRTR
jgi:hypothetical protein